MNHRVSPVAHRVRIDYGGTFTGSSTSTSFGGSLALGGRVGVPGGESNNDRDCSANFCPPNPWAEALLSERAQMRKRNQHRRRNNSLDVLCLPNAHICQFK